MSAESRHKAKAFAGIAVSVLIGSLAVWVLYRTFQRISLADVLIQMRATSLHTLLLAAACAACAFTVLALYETVVVHYVKDDIGRAKPIVTALIAFPLGHAIGQAMLSGGAIRYRMYSPAGFSAREVGATVLMCNLAYGLAVGLMLDLSLVLAADRLAPLFRISSTWLMAIGGIGLVKDVGYMLLVIFRDAPVRLRGWSFNLPTPAMTAVQYVVGLIDVALVSSVLYLLLPDSAQLSYLPFVAVYLASVLVGIVSHVPAGLGVIESVLLLLLPDIPPEQLLASVLMYRVIVEIIPLLISLALWGTYEAFARDGVRLRLMRPRKAAPRDSQG
ncbi:MAG TPA: lysylphosphatidylglycerol synthase domain-containing protein [Steroidobacteraceae bacterium]